MQKLSEIIFSEYQTRKTKAQKTAFIDLMKQFYPDLQIEEGGMFSNRNIIIGDVEHADFVLTAHYDTCARIPFPNFLAPKNLIATILYSLLIALPFLFLIIAVEVLLLLLSVNEIAVATIALILVFGSMFFIFYFGKPNEHTANDNTSGVIALCELLETLTPEQKKHVAFVFFDNEEYGLLGSGFFRKLHKKNAHNFLLINMDCISDGDHILLVANKAARNKFGDLFKSSFQDADQKKFHFENAATTLYPSDQMNFPVHLAIAAFHKKPLIGYYIDKIHTKHDTVFDEKNIECICKGIQTFIEKAASVH